ncbi:MAG: L,D-transpeptidase/peptidoglycan binding protein [Actinomycetota bacterium]|nr:L,D-transpeptidase/peptidoglycan binding protein [Actinomycetota bacterium]
MIHKLALSLLVAVGFGTAVPAAGVSLPVVPRDVEVGNVTVGGLISVQAQEQVERRYRRPIKLFYRDRTWSVAPARVGATAAVDDAIDRAVRAKPGSRLPLRIQIRREVLRRFVARLDRAIARPAVDAKLVGLGADLVPSFTDARRGRRVARAAMTRILTRAVRSSFRDARLQVKTVAVPPKTTAADYGPIVVIRRTSNRLYLYDGSSLVRTFTVATGQAQYPTPLGDFEIVVKERNPTWNPPDSEWADGAEPVPPGPGNPLGTRWMGLSAYAVGIHGTPDPASLGYSVSHGCIRMAIPDAEWLFENVGVGTPVYIVAA